MLGGRTLTKLYQKDARQSRNQASHGALFSCHAESVAFFVHGGEKLPRPCPKRAVGRPFMADETKATEQQASDEPTSTEPDWKAKYEAMRQHSRDWERKAKENEGAASELEQLKAANLAEQEKEKERADKAEAELNELKAQAERAELIASVADKANVPTEFVQMLNGADADELAAQVERALKLLPAYPTRTDDGGTSAVAKKSTAQQFAGAIESFI